MTNQPDKPSVEGLMKLVFAFGTAEAKGLGKGTSEGAAAYKAVSQYAERLASQSAAAPPIAPVAWLCEFMREDDTTATEVVLEDPQCTRWADCADGDGVSPYRVTPLYAAPPSAVLLEVMEALIAAQGYVADYANDDGSHEDLGAVNRAIAKLRELMGEKG